MAEAIAKFERQEVDSEIAEPMAHYAPHFEPTVSPSSPASKSKDGFAHRLGRIVAVTGSQAVALLDHGHERYRLAEEPPLQIGSLVKMRTPYTIVFGLVTGLSIPAPSNDSRGSGEHRIIELDLLGEMPVGTGELLMSFRRGVSFFPSLADPIYATTPEDLANVYTFPTASAVPIGTIHQDRTIPAYVVTDDLLGKHFAILGTTGTGKSCAVALILRAILSKHRNGHVLLLDVHNEYAPALGDRAVVLDPSSLHLPYWLLNFEEIEEIVVNSHGQDREVEAAILNEVIVAAKKLFVGRDSAYDRLTVDTPVPYRLGDVGRLLDEAAGRLDRPRDSAPYMRLKSRFAALQSDPRFDFMFPGLTVRDNMAQILSQLFRVPVENKPVTIVDLSGVPSEILNVVVSVLCRMTFDFALWSERSMPMLLVCEEAHRYVPHDPRKGFEPTKRAISQIAKEGRKYGVSLCLVSQRPSELATEIVSQCNTIFALRMSNQKDHDFVRGAMSESGIGLMDFLPSLRNAEAIGVGEGVSVPMRLCFENMPADQRPMSGTASFSAGWSRDVKKHDFVEAVVERWRRQRR